MKRPFLPSLLLVLLALIMLTGVASALAPMALDWWVMGGGGAPRADGPLSINATIGQPVIGHSYGGPLALSAGYWFGPAQADEAQHSIYVPLLYR